MVLRMTPPRENRIIEPPKQKKCLFILAKGTSGADTALAFLSKAENITASAVIQNADTEHVHRVYNEINALNMQIQRLERDSQGARDNKNVIQERLFANSYEFQLAEAVLRSLKETDPEYQNALNERNTLERRLLAAPSYQEAKAAVTAFESTIAQGERRRNTLLSNAYDTIIPVLKTADIDVILYEPPAGGDLIDDREFTQVRQLINQLGNNIEYDIINIGGGHGSPTVLSGFDMAHTDQLLNQMQTNGIRANVIALGSCESACHLEKAQASLGKDNTVVIGAMGDCAKTFFVTESLDYATGNSPSLFNALNYNPSDRNDTKATALALLYKNKITAFDLPRDLRDIEEQQFWSDSFVRLFLNKLDEASQGKKVERRAEIQILGSNPPAVHDSLAQCMQLDIQAEKNLIPLFIGTKLEKRQTYGLDSYQLENIGLCIVHYCDLRRISDEVGEKIGQYLPQFEWTQFSENPQDRVTAMNLVIARALPPAAGLYSQLDKSQKYPITPEIVSISIAQPGTLSELVQEGSLNIKSIGPTTTK